MNQEDLTQVGKNLKSRVLKELQGYMDYYQDVSRNSEPGWPTFAQAIRMKALLDKKRILVADDTGANGKTFTGVASKFELDKTLGKRARTIVISPNSGLYGAWSQGEVDKYAQKMHVESQRVVPIFKRDDYANVTKETDFVVVNWEKLSQKEASKSAVALDDLVQNWQPELFILDEVHNAKSKHSNRGQTIQRLVPFTLDKHALLLSATPIPNRIRDLGIIFHLLDPVKYKDPGIFSHYDPEVMKEILDRQVWFRITLDELKDELGLPDFHEKVVPVHLSDAESEIYFKAWSDCVQLGEGFPQLRKALYDPRLSKYYDGHSDINTSVLDAVGRLADEKIAAGEKVVVKTNYVTGIIDNITAAIGRNREVLVVDGSVTDRADRARRFLQFRNSSRYNALVVSTVGEESVDLTTGDIPASWITMEPELTPREFKQGRGRLYRRGQNREGTVTHHTMIAESPYLNNLMITHLKGLAEEYGLKIPKKFSPRTIHADMYAMRLRKQAIVEDMYRLVGISRKDEWLHDADWHNAANHFAGLMSARDIKEEKPFQQAIQIQVRWRNLGEEQFTRLVDSPGWRSWRRLYEDGWKGSASHATQDLIGRGMDALEGKMDVEPVIASVGDGAAYLSRATGRDGIYCLDLDGKFLQIGKRVCDKLGLENRYLPCRATALDLPNEHVDILVNSYSLFYMGQDKKRSEVEKAVLESNRVLKESGYFMLALPFTVDDRLVDRFNSHMPSYGFKILEYATPKQTKERRMKNGCHLMVYEKVKRVNELQDVDLSFYDGRVKLIG